MHPAVSQSVTFLDPTSNMDVDGINGGDIVSGQEGGGVLGGVGWLPIIVGVLVVLHVCAFVRFLCHSVSQSVRGGVERVRGEPHQSVSQLVWAVFQCDAVQTRAHGVVCLCRLPCRFCSHSTFSPPPCPALLELSCSPQGVWFVSLIGEISKNPLTRPKRQ